MSGLKLDADRQAALQFRQQVGRLRDVKCAGGDEQDVVCFHRPMLGVDGGALDQRQQVALHAFARNVSTALAFAPRDFVYLVKEDDAILFNCT